MKFGMKIHYKYNYILCMHGNCKFFGRTIPVLKINIMHVPCSCVIHSLFPVTAQSLVFVFLQVSATNSNHCQRPSIL